MDYLTFKNLPWSVAALFATSMGCGDIANPDNFSALWESCGRHSPKSEPNAYVTLDPSTIDCPTVDIWSDLRTRMHETSGLRVNFDHHVCWPGSPNCVAHADPSLFADGETEGVTLDNWAIVISPDLSQERYAEVAMRELVVHMSRKRSAAPKDGCLDEEAIAAICHPERGWKCDYEVPEDCGEEDP